MKKKSKLEILKSLAIKLNKCLDNQTGTPLYNKFMMITKYYFQENKIGEISINDFSALTGLNKQYSKSILIYINKEIFNK